VTRRRRLALLTAAAAAALSAASVAAFAETTPTPSPSEALNELPVLVTLSGVTPLAPQPGDTLAVRGRLSDQAGSPVSNLRVQLAVSRTKVGSRGEFDDFAATPDGAAPIDATVPSTETATLTSSDLDVGATDSFSVTVPVNDLQLPQAWQVYEMTIVVTGDTVTGTTTVGRLRTFLPWAPLDVPGVGLPTRLAWVWPLVDRPHRSDGTTWVDDDLSTSLAGDGRLNRLVTAGAAAEVQSPPALPRPRSNKGRHRHRHRTAPPKPPQPTIQRVPVTWVIDPQLIDDATAMKSAYTVAKPTGGTRPGRGGAAAKQWLTEMESAVGKSEVFGLPYADPDVVAAVRAGLGTEVQLANSIGDTIIKNALGRTPLPYAWPPNGLADQRTLDTLFAAGETTVVLDSEAVPVVGGPPSETPGAHAKVPFPYGNFDALLADHTLNGVIDAGAHSGAAGPMAIQRLLSELLMIQAEHPFDQRSLVVTPSRRWAPSASYAAAVLSDTGKVPWVQPVSLSQVADGPVYDAVQRPRLQFTTEDRDLLLRHTYLARVDRVKHLIDAFRAIVVPPTDPRARGFTDGVLRLLSSAWRSDPVTARTVRDSLDMSVRKTMGLVRIASHPGSLVTLTSHSGIVPVTVANDLDTPVRIVVEIRPDQHLVVKSAHVARTIGAHRQVPIDVRATAQTSGVFGLTVRLATPSPLNRHYGPAVPLRVRSTAYGSTALLITGGATAVLLLTVVFRLVRRARAARRTVPIAS
jgi:hypothetical protein